MSFGVAAKEVLRITPDGRFILGDGATNDDAAQAILAAARYVWDERQAIAAVVWNRLGIRDPKELEAWFTNTNNDECNAGEEWKQ